MTRQHTIQADYQRSVDEQIRAIDVEIEKLKGSTPRVKDTVGELDSVDLREEKGIGWTEVASRTITAKEIQHVLTAQN